MRTLLFLGLGLSLLGCGDDDTRPTTDAGGTDAPPAEDAATTEDAGDRTDGGADVDSGPSPSMCPPGACNVETNAGCDVAMGEGCYWATSPEGEGPAAMCVPAGGGVAGSPCEFVNSCREGHTCFLGTCRPVCCGSASSCSLGDLCVGAALPPGTPGALGTCVTPSDCSVVEQSGCDGGRACYVISQDGSALCIPPPSPGVATGGACSSLNECAPGNVCLGSPGACRRACNPMAAMVECGTDFRCANVTGWPATLGACVPMTGG